MLLIEPSEVVKNTKRDLQEEIRIQYQKDYDMKTLNVEEQYHRYKWKLGQRRLHKQSKTK